MVSNYSLKFGFRDTKLIIICSSTNLGFNWKLFLQYSIYSKLCILDSINVHLSVRIVILYMPNITACGYDTPALYSSEFVFQQSYSFKSYKQLDWCMHSRAYTISYTLSLHVLCLV